MRIATSILIVAVVLSLPFAGHVAAQTPLDPKPVPQAVDDSQVSVDQDFILNIGERRIIETDFSAATNVALGGDNANGVRVQAGVSLHADSINVLLRNVFGSVRFRASLQRILDVVNAHPTLK